MLRTNETTPSLCSFRTAAEFEATAGAGVLGAVRHGDRAGPVRWEHGRPVLPLHMVRPGVPEVVEVWEATGPVTTGEHRGLHYAHDGEVLFGAVDLGPSVGCGAAARAAYLAAFDLVDRLGYPHLFRMWNVIEGITDPDADGAEVYTGFCVGRARAFDESPRPVPAATGIGALGGGAGFYFLAHRSRRAVHLENPLQVPAHEYPERYGPRSPSFARATWLEPEPGRDRGVLYVSGTASILDDATVCPGDVVRQCQVALANIAALIGPDNLARHGLPGGWALPDLRRVKVYVKRPGDVPVVTRLCREEFSRRAEVAVFAVDVCRPDLLVEVEGIAP